uniref:Uncharacterized protein n=1 Tax=Siphoviridae sp. ctiMP24 TaxID=2825621 RepID=A0A8S5P080_9CAUD|nr:MAG TPA: hypothetical protein [Siphoviridae sp. ctiMP24]
MKTRLFRVIFRVIFYSKILDFGLKFWILV